MRYKVFEGRQVIGLLAILFCFTNLVYSQSDTNTTTTINTTTTPGDNNPALKLIIIIVIPTLAITVICIVCVVIGVRKTRNSGRKWWKIYGNGRQPTASQLENADPQAKLEFSIQQMNHYMDIKAMADQFKNDKWEIKGKDLLVHDDCLGNGAFACVFRGTLKGKIPLFKVYASLQLVLEHTTGETSEVAVKKLPAHANHEGRVDFFHEMSFMKRLGYHPHVISMLGCVSNPIDPLIVVEYCKHGDLLRFLRKNKGSILKDETPKESKENDYPDYEVPMKIKDLVSIAWQVCDGLCYLSSHKFIHRDVAARNILLTKGMCAKISDFGLCRYADSSLYTAKGGRLPIKWMAPESLKFYEYTEKTEVWSYGIMLHEMFSLGEAPYPSVQPMEMIQYLEEGNRMRQPVKCPNEMYILMKGAWEFKGEDRPTFDELRAKISMLLNLGDEQYGYLSLPTSSGPTSPSGVTQLTFQDDQCALTDEMLGRQPKGPTDGPEEEGERKLSENPQFDMAKLVEMKMAWKKKKKAINEKLQIHVEIDEANDKAIISRELLDKMRYGESYGIRFCAW
ncbi:unnamed protein product, partial [Mesorhabditis belari]|uniref:Protein kinase domain-containing protein n=1 Tax=Mesorhabditis belari TaxID=2138241 RepID=A0AAF3J580_9BILA